MDKKLRSNRSKSFPTKHEALDSLMTQPRILEVRTKILKKNDELARQMRNEFTDAGVLVINLVSSPGTGKTTLLRETLISLMSLGERVAAIVGDLETDHDATRLASSGAPVRQIMTHGCCHLEADMISDHLSGWDLSQYDYLFIENVGNLVCPTSWDLGESLRAALLSVTEGEEKPLKYPGLFNTSDKEVTLHLLYRGKEVILDSTMGTVILGRGQQADMIINDSMASREHARVECRRGRFILIDQSTNGTYVQTTEGPAYLRREELQIDGEGKITLGRELNEATEVVVFETA